MERKRVHTRKPKPIFDRDLPCAWCGKPNHVTVNRKVITPAEPAEVELEVLVERSTQATLDRETEDE
jgi:hypothetical protein